MNKIEMDLEQIFGAYTVTLEDMLLDLKALLKEYYCATFTYESKSLKIALNNGQKFFFFFKAF